MNYLYIINPIFSSYNYINELFSKTFSTIHSIYRLCTVKPIWYILENGQFANSSDMGIFDIPACWMYDGSTISKTEPCNTKKLPFLSFEFVLGNKIINMDDFIENTKFRNNQAPPLPVIMAAFCINTKILYPWSSGNFTVFNKMGDVVYFSGEDNKFPDKV